jgi:hypothetical protein
MAILAMLKPGQQKPRKKLTSSPRAAEPQRINLKQLLHVVCSLRASASLREMVLFKVNCFTRSDARGSRRV